MVADSEDVIEQLQKTLPAAHSSLSVTTPPRGDVFGQVLLKQLREAGYAVFEQPAPSRWRRRPPAGENTLTYVKDKIGDEDMIRVEVAVGSRRWSRLFVIKNERIFGAGVWTRRE